LFFKITLEETFILDRQLYPKQQDAFNCGMCIITMAESLALSTPVPIFSQENISFMQLFYKYRLINNPIELRPMQQVLRNEYLNIPFPIYHEVAWLLIKKVHFGEKITDMQLTAWGRRHCLSHVNVCTHREQEKIIIKIVKHMISVDQIFIKAEQQENYDDKRGSCLGFVVTLNPKFDVSNLIDEKNLPLKFLESLEMSQINDIDSDETVLSPSIQTRYQRDYTKKSNNLLLIVTEKNSSTQYIFLMHILIN